MSLTSRDDTGMKAARSLSGVKSASDRFPPALIPMATTESVRHRFVVGIFGEPPSAYAAVKDLSPSACDMLVVLDSAPGEATAATVTDGRVIIHHLDTSDALASKLAAALAKFAPFAALGSGVRDPHGEATSPPGLRQRLFQNLVHHLAAGAAVVIVHAPDSEHQLQISRALLEAKCDVLLTHDVLQAAACAPSEPAHDDDCCQSCTSQACRRTEPIHNGTARSKE